MARQSISRSASSSKAGNEITMPARKSISRRASSSKAGNEIAMPARKSISRSASSSKAGKEIAMPARKSISRRASSSSTAGDTSKPGNKSKPSSTYQCNPFSYINKYRSKDGDKTVHACALDVLVSISQFFSMARKSGKSISQIFAKGSKSRKSISKFLFMARKSRSRSASSSSKSSFTDTYQCYPYHSKDGNKIIMPASALDVLLPMKKIKYPMTFMITNTSLGKVSHCGVLQFTAKEGNVYLPNWMMNNLKLQQGQTVKIEYTGLSKATSLKIQPRSTKLIMNLPDPKEVMDLILKNFACVTIGDTIMVHHENQRYYIDIVEAMPKDAVSLLIERDCELEFEIPLDFKERSRQRMKNLNNLKTRQLGK